MKKLLMSLAMPLLVAAPVWADELGSALPLHAMRQDAAPGNTYNAIVSDRQASQPSGGK